MESDTQKEFNYVSLSALTIFSDISGKYPIYKLNNGKISANAVVLEISQIKNRTNMWVRLSDLPLEIQKKLVEKGIVADDFSEKLSTKLGSLKARLTQVAAKKAVLARSYYNAKDDIRILPSGNTRLSTNPYFLNGMGFCLYNFCTNYLFFS